MMEASEEDVRAGRTIPHEEVLAHLQSRRSQVGP
jgi:predicted transcriptional regulator